MPDGIQFDGDNQKMSRITNHIVASLFVAVYVFLPTYAWSQSEAHYWPRLEKTSNLNNTECGRVLDLAKAAFQSDHVHIYDFFNSDKTQISYDDPTAFQTIAKTDPNTGEDIPIHWQRQADNGQRWVIAESNFGWRGNQYAVYLIGADITPDQFQAHPGTPVIFNTWNKPIIRREKSTGPLWIIDVGAPYNALDNWTVFVGQNGKAMQQCKIYFGPHISSALKLLPKPVEQYAKMLDGTLGSGKNEGTLHPTASLRAEMSHVWVNVALRPWALRCANQPDHCSGEKDQTDLQLKNWSTKAVSFKRLYDRIYQQRPLAKKSLTEYYEKTFSLQPEKASLAAEYALTDALITNYSFPTRTER